MRGRIIFLLVWAALTGQTGHAQTLLTGHVRDSVDQPIEEAFVVLYAQRTDALLAYRATDPSGFYALTARLAEGLYRLEVTRLGYDKYTQQILVTATPPDTLTLDAVLRPTDATRLDEVVVQQRPPVIIKQDTIIYDIASFTDAYDQTLEQVLAKLAGFKVLPNGDLEVNGKVIRKVLVDGKEVSDVGAALLTKTLSPQDVDQVEVRFDEKNKKIRESLLSDEKFVVLDIKLKPDLNKSLFGTQQLAAGYHEGAKVGAYGNLFSLNDRVNAQVFGEVDNFGRQRIKLEYIRHIGEEAFNRIFSLPADFESVKEREAYHDELFGFRDFVQQDNALVGVSVNVPLRARTDVYIGSFSHYHFLRNRQLTQQFFDQQLFSAFDLANTHRSYDTKNKVQLKHTRERLKWRSDLNYTAFDNLIGNQSRGAQQNRFAGQHRAHNLFFNNVVELRLGESWGLTLGTSLKREQFAFDNRLATTNPQVADFLGMPPREAFFALQQTNRNLEQSLWQEAKLGYRSKVGNHALGYRLSYQAFENEKLSEESTDATSVFPNPRTAVDYAQHALLYDYQLVVGNLSLDARTAWSQVRFPFEEGARTRPFFEFDAKGGYDFGLFGFNFATDHRLGRFPFERIIGGWQLLNFQTVFQPSTGLLPFFNRTYTGGIHRQAQAIKLEASFDVYVGTSDNLNNQAFAPGLILQQADQLRSAYTLYAISLRKRFGKLPVRFTLEPEMVNNQFAFRGPEGINVNRSRRHLLGLKAETFFGKRFDVDYLSKYSYFTFKNDLSERINVFNFLSQEAVLKTNLRDQQLTAQLHYKYVYFFGSGDTFQNVDVSVRGTLRSRLTGFGVVGNVLNANRFQIQDIDQALLTASDHLVFGRFFNVGLEYKFR